MEINPQHSFSVVQPARNWPGVRAFCTTREGGLGTAPFDTFNLGLGAGDTPEVVLANRQLLNRALPAEPAWLKQVHGVRVVDADDSTIFASNLNAPEADASVTTCPERVLAVLTADCLSVVLSDDRGSVLGAAHAGWKGLAWGVLEETLALMLRKQPKGSGWRAWIGPGIGAAAFQVGADVRDAFSTELAIQPDLCVVDPSVAERWRLDLAGIAQLRLHRMGVQDVELSHRCTVSNPKQFFSYRRDRQAGRMATVAWMASQKS
ncbi:MAG: peptidoglycan editing factor PgeF [Burkholderiaceae bacterium]|nr:peptidoglycan editing factor PgeF [Burkholderiaceae bacterium]